MLPPMLRRAVVAASLALVLVLPMGLPAGALQDGDTMTVTGGVVETVRFTVRDGVGNLQAHLEADAAHKGSDGLATFVESEGPDAGVCYAVPGEIYVSSNVEYDLLVSDDSAISGLHFLASTPASFTACAAGEPVSDTMFADADPASAWAFGQSRTPGRVHAFTLSLIVDPGDDPLSVLAASSLTILARPAG